MLRSSLLESSDMLISALFLAPFLQVCCLLAAFILAAFVLAAFVLAAFVVLFPLVCQLCKPVHWADGLMMKKPWSPFSLLS